MISGSGKSGAVHRRGPNIMSKLPTRRPLPIAGLIGLTALGLAAPAGAEMRPSLNFYGVTGLIDMPGGESQSDAALSFASAHFGPIGRNTLTFQITPRLSGSFRYSGVKDWDASDPSFTYYDRSFDLRYQLIEETTYLPAVTVGFQDIIGTGLWSAEYIAATKRFGDSVKVTAGLGWGRLGSYGAIGAPFGERPVVDFGSGGKVRLGQWFRGLAACWLG